MGQHKMEFSGEDRWQALSAWTDETKASDPSFDVMGYVWDGKATSVLFETDEAHPKLSLIKGSVQDTP